MTSWIFNSSHRAFGVDFLGVKADSFWELEQLKELSLTGVSKELKSLVLFIVNVGTYHRCARSPITCKFYSRQYHLDE